MYSYTEISKQFEAHFNFLSGRAKNIISDFKINNFEGFYQRVISQGLRIQFRAIRGCGENTQKELDQFFKNLLEKDQNLKDPILRKLSQDYLLNKKFKLHFQCQPKKVNIKLRELKANSFEGFYRVILQGDEKILSLYRLPDEIEVIKSNIESAVNSYFPEIATKGLFSALWFLLAENSHLNRKEGYVFKNNLLFLSGGQWEDYSKTGKHFKQTAENFRALSRRLIRDLQKIILDVNSNLKPELQQYLEDDFIVIDRRMAMMINETEKTAFTPSFINFVLMHLCEQVGYKFIKTTYHKNTFEGVFVKTDIGFDFRSFYDDCKNIALYEKRKGRVLLLKDIFKKYASFRYFDPDKSKPTRLVLSIIKSTPFEKLSITLDDHYLYIANIKP